jgi:hypothetical protein
MQLLDRLRAWLFPDPADALRAAEYEPLDSSTAQHPHEQPIAVPTGSEDARSMPNDLDDVRR